MVTRERTPSYTYFVEGDCQSRYMEFRIHGFRRQECWKFVCNCEVVAFERWFCTIYTRCSEGIFKYE